MRRRHLLALPALAALPRPARAEADAVRLSHGLGVLYLPLIVMREAKLLEAELDRAGIKAAVSWAVLDGGGQINDAMLAGALDIAGTSIPGFLTLWSKGRGTRSEVVGVSGLSTCALILNTNRPYIHKLADFKPDDKIAVPSVKVSLQAVVLQMAAAREFGDKDWARMDVNTVSMQHPIAAGALIGGKSEIAAHFASPPFTLTEAAAPNVHAVLRSPDVLGDITLDMVFGAKRFTSANPGHVKAFLAAQRAANELIKREPARATELFIQNSGSKVDPESILGVLRDPQTRFETAPHGFMKYVDFMQRAGTIRTVPKDWKEAFVPELEEAGS
ncbi:MAG TPA: ABC transporter substrate-binding protein [Acetobacteraceae bacterium]|nr:ABC transporter substrate-binding protein [Acetobacteraceae bacterium]